MQSSTPPPEPLVPALRLTPQPSVHSHAANSGFNQPQVQPHGRRPPQQNLYTPPDSPLLHHDANGLPVLYPPLGIVEDDGVRAHVARAPRRPPHRVIEIGATSHYDYSLAEYNSSLLYLNPKLKGTDAYKRLPFLQDQEGSVLFLPEGTPLTHIYKRSEKEINKMFWSGARKRNTGGGFFGCCGARRARSSKGKREYLHDKDIGSSVFGESEYSDNAGSFIAPQ